MHPATPAHSTALATALQRWRQRLPRTALVLVGVCVGIATLLLALGGGRFIVKITYSLCIGLSCTAINDLSWLAQAWGHDKLRSLRRLPPSPGPYVGGWAGVLPSAALCLLLGPPLGQHLADSVFGFNSPSLFNLDHSNARFTLVISGLATLVLIVVVSAAERLSTARAQAEAAQRQAAEAQLRLLQSQLEPHMLFNTLANLRVLIGLEPARAQAMLDHLIAFLRATLAASRRGEHPLADEFARVSDYLALMAVRMGPRLAVQLDLPADLTGVPVPPLLLQPLVENSIRHGLEPKVEGGCVQVTARREAQTLVLEVLDSGVGRDICTQRGTDRTADSAAESAADSTAHTAATPGLPAGGFGLSGVRERLATLYGERASLTLADAPGGGMRVSVRLPIVPVSMAQSAPSPAAKPGPSTPRSAT